MWEANGDKGGKDGGQEGGWEQKMGDECKVGVIGGKKWQIKIQRGRDWNLDKRWTEMWSIGVKKGKGQRG